MQSGAEVRFHVHLSFQSSKSDM